MLDITVTIWINVDWDSWCHTASQSKLIYLPFLAATKQLYKWYFPSVRPSVRLSVRLSVTPFWLCSHHRIIMKFSGVIISDKSDVHAKGQGQRSKVKVTEVTTQLEFKYDDEMMHMAWCCLEEVPYCFWRSSVKFQGHTALKIVEFYPNWAFPDCNSNLNSPMAMKCCTKLETGKERCPIVFQDHPSNFKVTQYKTSPILNRIGRFRTIGRSQLSNPSDLPC